MTFCLQPKQTKQFGRFPMSKIVRSTNDIRYNWVNTTGSQGKKKCKIAQIHFSRFWFRGPLAIFAVLRGIPCLMLLSHLAKPSQAFRCIIKASNISRKVDEVKQQKEEEKRHLLVQKPFARPFAALELATKEAMLRSFSGESSALWSLTLRVLSASSEIILVSH